MLSEGRNVKTWEIKREHANNYVSVCFQVEFTSIIQHSHYIRRRSNSNKEMTKIMR